MQQEQLTLLPTLPDDLLRSLPSHIQDLVSESLAVGMISIAKTETSCGPIASFDKKATDHGTLDSATYCAGEGDQEDDNEFKSKEKELHTFIQTLPEDVARSILTQVEHIVTSEAEQSKTPGISKEYSTSHSSMEHLAYEELLALQKEQMLLLPILPQDLISSLPSELASFVSESLKASMLKVADNETAGLNITTEQIERELKEGEDEGHKSVKESDQAYNELVDLQKEQFSLVPSLPKELSDLLPLDLKDYLSECLTTTMIQLAQNEAVEEQKDKNLDQTQGESLQKEKIEDLELRQQFAQTNEINDLAQRLVKEAIHLALLEVLSDELTLNTKKNAPTACVLSKSNLIQPESLKSSGEIQVPKVSMDSSQSLISIEVEQSKDQTKRIHDLEPYKNEQLEPYLRDLLSKLGTQHSQNESENLQLFISAIIQWLTKSSCDLRALEYLSKDVSLDEKSKQLENETKLVNNLIDQSLAKLQPSENKESFISLCKLRGHVTARQEAISILQNVAKDNDSNRDELMTELPAFLLKTGTTRKQHLSNDEALLVSNITNQNILSNFVIANQKVPSDKNILDQAESAYDHLLSKFHQLNNVSVASSTTNQIKAEHQKLKIVSSTSDKLDQLLQDLKACNVDSNQTDKISQLENQLLELKLQIGDAEKHQAKLLKNLLETETKEKALEAKMTSLESKIGEHGDSFSSSSIHQVWINNLVIKFFMQEESGLRFAKLYYHAFLF